jgi:hypothetical protein
MKSINEVGCRDTHRFGDVGAHVCDSKRKFATRRTIGSVSSNCWSVVDLCFARREIEISSVHVNGAQRFCSLFVSCFGGNKKGPKRTLRAEG